MGLGGGPWLVDKSALVRLADARDRATWTARIEQGLVRMTVVTMLEVGYSARNGFDHDSRLGSPPISLMPLEYATPGAERRAIEVQGLLAARGQHRAPSIPGILIAAIAEQAHLTVLHADKDFDVIADITGQSVARLAW